MSFNAGVIAAIKVTPGSGGVFSLLHVNGHHVGRGMTGSVAPMELYRHGSVRLPYPVDQKFDSRGVAYIAFAWDAATFPATRSTAIGVHATTFRYRTKIGATISTGNGDLLWLSNIGDMARIGPHFRLPSLPSGLTLTTVLSEAETRARQLAGVINSMSRFAIASVVAV